MKAISAALLAALVTISAAWSEAAPQQWVRHNSFSEFRQGEMKNIALEGGGSLTLGPEFEPAEAFPPQAFVWALVVDSAGRIYAGTGNQGTVYVLEGDEVRPALETEDLQVLSLALGEGDVVYAGCAPSGKIYRIPPDGEPDVFCETGQTYIWALAVSDTGHIYAATGPEGKILRIDPAGEEVEKLFDSPEPHILSMALTTDAVFAGSDRNGLVYRISKEDGDVLIAHDAPQTEIRSMAADDAGNIFFGSAEGIRPAPEQVPRRVPTQQTGGRRGGQRPGGNANQTSRRPPTDRRGAGSNNPAVAATNTVHRIDPEGRVTELFRMEGMAFLSMLWHDDVLYVGTAGEEGKIVRIASAEEVAIAAAIEQPHILSLARAREGGLLAGTGNDGRIYSTTALVAEEGTYTSPVQDTNVRSRWGTFALDCVLPGGTEVALSTRSGNSQTPDDTWSSWTEPTAMTERAKIESPPARFIQYRLALSRGPGDATPAVRRIAFPYLQQNYPPTVDWIRVAPGNAREHGGGTLSGVAAISWSVSDPNDDTLHSELFFRGADERNWKRLQNEPEQTQFTWDTHAVPDGTYELKVRVTDAPDNPPPRALSSSLVSEPVRVDNTPPTVEITQIELEGRRATIEATAEDAATEIAAARYSVNAGPWMPLLPVDEIFDQKIEHLQFTTEELGPGEHTLVIQTEDAAGNVGADKTVFEIPEE